MRIVVSETLDDALIPYGSVSENVLAVWRKRKVAELQRLGLLPELP